MNSLEITCFWKLDGPLHAGTGLSRIGYADRLIRRNPDGQAFIPGDAVKGTVRMSAERLLRWLLPDAEAEKEDKSAPTHPVLRRLFQPDEYGVFYRFAPALYRTVKPVDPVRISSTALDRVSRTALDDTLRTIEASSRQDEFEVHIAGENGDWSTPQSRDSLDGQFLVAALAAADSVGGKRGAGYGRLVFSGYSARGMAWPDLGNPETIRALQEHLRIEAPRETS